MLLGLQPQRGYGGGHAGVGGGHRVLVHTHAVLVDRHAVLVHAGVGRGGGGVLRPVRHRAGVQGRGDRGHARHDARAVH